MYLSLSLLLVFVSLYVSFGGTGFLQLYSAYSWLGDEAKAKETFEKAAAIPLATYDKYKARFSFYLYRSI